MIRRFTFAFLLGSLFFISAAQAATHPHLFFTADGVSGLRAKATSTHADIAQAIKASVGAYLGSGAISQGAFGDPREVADCIGGEAFAALLTNDSQYITLAKASLLGAVSWGDWSGGTGFDIERAHVVMNVAWAYDWLYGYLSDAERATVAKRLGDEADAYYAAASSAWWRDDYVQNHNWINHAAYGTAALALMGEDSRAGAWLADAQANYATLSTLLGGMGDASWHEGIAYQAYGLAFSLPFVLALEFAGTPMGDWAHLSDYGTWRAYNLVAEMPRETVLLSGDFYGFSEEETPMLLRIAASHARDGVAEWAAQQWLKSGRGTYLPQSIYPAFEYIFYDPSVSPIDPTSLALDARWPDDGASTMRSGFGNGSMAAAFRAGVYGGHFNWSRIKNGGAGHLNWGHDHNDDMGYTLFGAGTWLVPECSGYDAGVSSGTQAHNAAFHNTLLVDGMGQLGDDRVSDSEYNNPWFWSRESQSTFASTAHYAYAIANGAKLYPSSVGLTRFDRQLLFARGRYLAVRDELASSALHQFDTILHSMDAASVDGSWVRGNTKGGISLGVKVVAPAQFGATFLSQSASQLTKLDSDGNITEIQIHPATPSKQASMLLALMPVTTASWGARPAVMPLDAAQPQAGFLAPSVGETSNEETVVNISPGNTLSVGDLVTDGAAAAVARDLSGGLMRVLFVGHGHVADQSGARTLLATSSASALEADPQGDLLTVTGEGIADFRAYGPQVQRVTVNGTAVAFSHDGDQVVFPAVVATAGGSTGGTSGGTTGETTGASTGGSTTGDTPDAGMTTDAGSNTGNGMSNPPDAGSNTDGGTISTMDTGNTSDAGSNTGLGTIDAVDAGTTSEIGSNTGGGTSAVSGLRTDAPAPSGQVPARHKHGGCTTNRNGFGWMPLALVALALRRKSTVAVEPRRSSVGRLRGAHEGTPPLTGEMSRSDRGGPLAASKPPEAHFSVR